MNTKKLNFRTGLLVSLMLLTTAFFSMELYRLQIVQGENYVRSGSTYTQSVTVAAARGSILDRNGQVLVTNRPGYNITLNSTALLAVEDTSGTILSIVELCRENGVEHVDNLPITAPPFEYDFSSVGATQEGYFRSYLSGKKWDADITAENLIKRMMSAYGIAEGVYTDEQVRTIIGVRYEIDLRRVVNYLSGYVFAEDVDVSFLPVVKERKFPGVEIETVSFREYKTEYAAHILGRIAPLDPEDYEYYTDLGYPMDATVGKMGFELAFESYLHGVNGTKRVTYASEGKVVGESYTAPPSPGNNVVLTLDIQMQEVAEKALEACILDFKENGTTGVGDEGKDVQGGAVVVMDVNTFEILASASYPTYDITAYNRDFDYLKDAPNQPLYNRVLLAPYEPGSTYKMVTAVAAVDEGEISMWEEIQDQGIYMYYAADEYLDSDRQAYTPLCSYYRKTGETHGLLNVMDALSVSCNYFFYEVGRRVQIDRLDGYAEDFGLGEATGVELYEELGTRANRENKEKNGESWYSGDTLQAAIGQSDNVFTPMQLACYISTLANGGTRYNAHYLDRVLSSDYTQVIDKTEQTVLSEVYISEEAMTAVKEGMYKTSKEGGTAGDTFGNYDIMVCSKTGTAQHGGLGSDNATFACFAPYNNPEIAIVVFVEKGGQGGKLAKVAREILDYYFASGTSVEEVPIENEIMR